MNQGETEMIAESLGEEYERVGSPEKADLSIIGTCVVIKKTEERMKRRIEELDELSDRVVVAGCLASTSPEEVRELCPDAKMVDAGEVKTGTGPFESKLIGDLPISSGCIGDCSYCITKLARGALKSRDGEKLKSRFKSLISSGAREIRLTCQDTASYGLDRNDKRLPELLDELTDMETDKDYRIRIGMMNPDTVSPILDEFLSVMKDEHIYDFLHLPLQSGSDSVLESMNRNYDVDRWMDIVKRFREELPELTLSTDIIVGFPGEDEEDFEKTKEVLMDVKPDIVNVTRFSPRPGTEAMDMDEKVHSSVKKERSKELSELRLKLSRERNERYVGREEEVLFLEEGKDDSLKGRMDNYKVVVLKDGHEDKELIGKWVSVKIVDAAEVYLLGELID